MGIYNKKNLAIFDIPIIYICILFHNKLHESAKLYHSRLQKSQPHLEIIEICVHMERFSKGLNCGAVSSDERHLCLMQSPVILQCTMIYFSPMALAILHSSTLKRFYDHNRQNPPHATAIRLNYSRVVKLPANMVIVHSP